MAQINLLDFGVVADGVVDDSDACEKAIAYANTGDVIYLPKGKTIRVTRAISLPRDIGLCKWLLTSKSTIMDY